MATVWSPTPPLAATNLIPVAGDRKSTRLNSSHSQISYAVFCLKKKKTQSNLAPIAITQLPPLRLPTSISTPARRAPSTSTYRDDFYRHHCRSPHLASEPSTREV